MMSTHLGGRRICQKVMLLSISLFSKNGWQGGGRGQNLKKWVMSFMEGPYIYFYQSCFLSRPFFQPKHEFVSRYPYLVPYSNIFLDNTDHVISLWNIENSWSIFLESTLVDCLPNLHLHIPIQIQILLMLNHLEKNSSHGYYQNFK